MDIYDFDKKINLQDMMATAEKLEALDANNAAAFRATVYVYRHEDRIQSVVDYCKKVLAENSSVDISIEACAQPGDIYSGTEMLDMKIITDRIYNIKYRTDW